MKKKILYLSLLLFLFLVGCESNTTTNRLTTKPTTLDPTTTNDINSNTTTTNTPTKVTTTVTTTTVTVTTGKPTTTTTPTTSTIVTTTEKQLVTINSLSDAYSKENELKNKVNEKGVAESNYSFELDGKILARLDAITTQSGYGDRYKVLIANDEGVLYLKCNLKQYNMLENHMGEYIHAKGTLSYYVDKLELTITEDFKFITRESNDYESYYTSKTIKDVYTDLEKVNMNTKGCAYTSLVKVTAKYIATMDDVVLLFYDGLNIIQVHGQSKFKNSLTEGNTYDIYGIETMYNFKPGIEYVFSKKSNEMETLTINKSELKLIDSSIYNIKYEVDKNSRYQNYTDQFGELRLFKGYINYYLKDSKYYFVLDTNLKDGYYSAYTNARDNKALFIKNESCANKFKYEIDYVPILDDIALEDGTLVFSKEVEFVVAPYLWNTNKYWQVYVIEGLE